MHQQIIFSFNFDVQLMFFIFVRFSYQRKLCFVVISNYGELFKGLLLLILHFDFKVLDNFSFKGLEFELVETVDIFHAGLKLPQLCIISANNFSLMLDLD